MDWLIPITLNAPAAIPELRPHRAMQIPLALARPRFELGAAPTGDTPLAAALAAAGFAARLPPPDPATLAVPPPWRALTQTRDPAQLALAATAETALALGLATPPAKRPARAADLLVRLPRGGDLERGVREALAFALVDGHLAWSRGSRLLEDWDRDRRTVIQDRAPLDTARRPAAPPLLVQGYALLDCLERLRGRRLRPADLETAWTGYRQAHPAPPLAFGLAYWAEATYRLSEQGDLDGAGAALERLREQAGELIRWLPGQAEALDGGMWWHHLGRLAYYAGDFATALDLFAREWRFRDRLDLARRARLTRNLAGLLIDMGYLTAAEGLLDAELERQRLEQDPECYKSLGKLGEALLRQGRLADARAAYQESLAGQNPAHGGQSAVYLGHAALLAGDLDEAGQHYGQALRDDGNQGLDFNPYRAMGEAALALRQGQPGTLADLWEMEGPQLQGLRGLKALPGAVVAAARHQAGQLPGTELRLWVERLIQADYALEVLYLLPLAFARPAAAPLEAVEQTLGVWAKACRDHRPALGLGDPPPAPAPTPDNLLAALARVREAGDWTALAPYRPRLYPFSLLERAGP